MAHTVDELGVVLPANRASGDIALDVTNLASFRHCVRRSRAKNLPAEALGAHGREATVAGQRKNRVRVTVFLLG